MAVEWLKNEEILRLLATREPEHALAALAAKQHGLVALRQLSKLGISGEAARMREKAGRFHRVRRGIYAIGYRASTREAQLMAAVLACGEEAVISHRSAAALWRLLEDRRATIDVSTPRRRGRTFAGINTHCHGAVSETDITMVQGIPCTAVPRTLLDLASAVSTSQLRKAVAEAEVERILNLSAVRRLIERNPGRRGVARLRVVIEELDPATKRTRSELERRFLALCRKAGLPPPEVNVLLDLGDICLRPDFLWRDARLIIETDGRQYHDTHSARESDSRREQRLQIAGWRVSHCTWAQVVHEPHELAAIVRGLLSQA